MGKARKEEAEREGGGEGGRGLEGKGLMGYFQGSVSRVCERGRCGGGVLA